MIHKTLLSVILGSFVFSSVNFAYHPTEFQSPLEVIAFGSCNRASLPQPLWPVIAGNQPDLWIWCGDNIYGDSKKVEIIEAKYQQQLKQPNYAAFRQQFPIIGIWDDHDYGRKNADASYPLKTVTQTLALDFMEVPASDPRRKRDGIYGAYDFGPEGRRVKVVLLDNRYFRSPVNARRPQLLGLEQKAWLVKTLLESKAQIHILVSGTQVIAQEHSYEKWSDYPAERAWLLDFVKEAAIPGVIFISGDRHFHEISVLLDSDSPYPLVDVTSSGLTHSWKNFAGEPNRHRMGEVFTGLGFGLLKIDWQRKSVTLTAEIRDRSNQVMNDYRIELPRGE